MKLCVENKMKKMSLMEKRVGNNREGGQEKTLSSLSLERINRFSDVVRYIENCPFDDPALMPFPVSTNVARQIHFTDFYTLYPVP